jgi:hypothetical protein
MIHGAAEAGDQSQLSPTKRSGLALEAIAGLVQVPLGQLERDTRDNAPNPERPVLAEHRAVLASPALAGHTIEQERSGGMATCWPAGAL